MNAQKIFETGNAVIFLTLQLIIPQATQDSNNKILQSRFFFTILGEF